MKVKLEVREDYQPPVGNEYCTSSYPGEGIYLVSGANSVFIIYQGGYYTLPLSILHSPLMEKIKEDVKAKPVQEEIAPEKIRLNLTDLLKLIAVSRDSCRLRECLPAVSGAEVSK